VVAVSLFVGCGEVADTVDTGPRHPESDGDGFTLDIDCDDDNPDVWPGATEYCNGLDDDCNAEIDDRPVDGDPYYIDADGDGHGDPKLEILACDQPVGAVVLDDDCDDEDYDVYPLADEICDDVDNDCDGLIDEDPIVDGPVFYEDADGDGYGNADESWMTCVQPSGYVSDDTDCDDTAAAAHPGGTEVCDTLDNDCDGVADLERVPTDHSTLSEAIAAVADGGEICIEPGTLSEAVDLSDRQLTITGAGGPEHTVWDLGGGSLPLVVADGGDTALTIRGLTLSGLDLDVSTDEAVAGSFLYLRGGSVTLDELVFSDLVFTQADDARDINGGLIYAYGAELALSSVTLSNLSITQTAVEGGETLDVDGALLHAFESDVNITGLDVSALRLETNDAPEALTLAGLVLYLEGSTYSFEAVSVSDVVVSQNAVADVHGRGALIHLADSTGSASGVALSTVDVAMTGASATLEGLVYLSGGSHTWSDVDLHASELSVDSPEDTQGSGAIAQRGGELRLTGLVATDNHLTVESDESWWGEARGGVLHQEGGDLALAQADLRGNSVSGRALGSGGALHIDAAEGEAVLENVLVVGNVASASRDTAQGGGIALEAVDGALQLSNVELVANEVSGRTALGGGLFVDGSAVDYLVVRNSSIVDSVLSASLSGDGREVYRADWNSGFLWAYTNVYNSDYDLFETDGDETGESGNLSEDPLHADRSAESVNDWDLHLSAESPLVDAGDPSIEDADGSRSDLGAYGGSEGGW